MARGQNGFIVEIVSGEVVLDAVAQLRIEAWSANGELPAFISNQDMRKDEHEKHATHIAVMHEGRPVAAARMCIHHTATECPDPESLDGYQEELASPIATFSRLVVHPNFRRRGLPRLLSERRIAIAKDSHCGSIVCCLEQRSRMKEMELLGFKRLGPTKIRYLSYAESIVYALRM
jgi:GNAT superfamily N-acetyltransferase